MLQPEPGMVDLAEARRIVAGGAGLVPGSTTDGAAVIRLLADVGAALGVERRRHPGGHRRRAGRATTGRSAPPGCPSTRTSTSRSASPAPRSTSAGSAPRDMW